jgi:hypothetical protein
LSDIAESVGSGLKGKIGPVPIWVIALGVGGTAAAGYYVYARRSGAAGDSSTGTAETAAVSGIVADGTMPEASTSDQSYGTVGYTPSADSQPVDTGTPVNPSTSTNSAWLSKAVTAVAGSTSMSRSDIVAGLTKYLNGEPITVAEKGYVDRALSLIGLPPEGTSGVSSVIPPPAPKPPAPKPTTQPKTPNNVPKGPTATKVTPSKHVLYYARVDNGMWVVVYTDHSIKPVEERTAKAHGASRVITQGLKVIKGPGVSYVKLQGTPNIYAHSKDLGYYHLSSNQYAMVGKPHAKTVKSIR